MFAFWMNSLLWVAASLPLTMMIEYDGAILQVVPSRQGNGVATPTFHTPVAEFRVKQIWHP